MHRLLERLSIVLVALLWGYTALTVSSSPDTIPIHFNFAGEADGWGSKTTLWLLPLIATFLVALMSLIKSFPQHMNYPFAITDENRERQQELAFTMLSAIACVIPLLFCFIIYSTEQYVKHGSFELSIALVLAVVFVPIVIYFYLAYKAR